MRRINQYLLAIGLLIASSLCLAGVSDAQIEKYVQDSGLEGVFDVFEDQIDAQLNQLVVTVDSPEIVDKVRAIMHNSWDSNQAHSTMHDYLKGSFSEEQMGELLDWYDQPWVQSIKLAEKQSESPNFESEMMRYFEDMARNPPSPDRAALVQDFVTKSRMTEHMLSMMVSTVGNMKQAFDKASGGNTAFSAVDEEQLVATMEPNLKQQLTMYSFFLYRDITDEDLKKYTEFYAADLGNREMEIVTNGISAVMEVWSDNLAEEAKAVLDL